MASVWGRKLAKKIAPHMSMVRRAYHEGDPDGELIRANWEKCQARKFTEESDYNEVMAAVNRLKEKRA